MDLICLGLYVLLCFVKMARALILIRFAAARTHFSRSPSGQLGSPWPLVAFAARPGVRVAGLDVFVCCFCFCLLLRPTSERASPDRALALLPAALPTSWGGGATLAPRLVVLVCACFLRRRSRVSLPCDINMYCLQGPISGCISRLDYEY